MAMEMYNYCVLCNPENNWLEVEFRSENDEPINGLKVTITNPSTLQTHQMIAHQGHCVFGDIAAGEWVVSVETENLLSTVEQYASRKEGEASPVKVRTDCEVGAAHEKQKQYYHVSVGDLWATPPEDTFLIDNHGALMSNVRPELNGFRGYHNATFVLEIKALRSYMPMIVDTDEFSLVNSYTFALLAQQAYASDTKSIDKKTATDTAGSLSNVVKMLKLRQRPLQAGIQTVNWLLQEVPYSQALDFDYYTDNEVGAQGYILFNDEIAILGVRGTEVAFGSQAEESEDSTLIISQVKNGIDAVVQSPLVQDLVRSDFDAKQIAPPEFGGSYVHRGFYQYGMALWNKLKADVEEFHRNKNFFTCGHSLGGAGALLLSALIQDAYHPFTLRLYTYGMPRTGTRSFIERYKDILHYRHVNNHDLVPQIPMTWADVDISISGVDLANRIALIDMDEDNYLHHGKLSQLITYDEPHQVLLTPRQTQITMLDMAKLAENDSVALVDGLWNSSVNEHFMTSYVPNLFNQLQALSKESLHQNYQQTIHYLTNKTQEQHRRYLAAKNAWAEALGLPYSPANEAKKTLIKQEIAISEQLTNNYQRVAQELTNIMNNPERLPLSLLLLANQSLSEEIKDQMQ